MTFIATRTTFLFLLFSVQFIDAEKIIEFNLADLRDLQVAERKKPSDDKQLDFTALFFDNTESRKLYPHFIKEYQQAANPLKEFNIQLAKLNCEELKEDLNYCHKNYQKLHIYRHGQLQSELLLDTVFSEDAIAANLLQVALNDKVRYISDQQELDSLLISTRNVQNVVLGYIKGMGIKEHRYILENVHRYSLKFTFALTTNEKLAKNLGFSPGEDASVWLFHCKPPFPRKKFTLCQREKFNWNLDKLSIAQFLQFQFYPKVDILSDDGESAYSERTPSIAKLYVFNDTVNQVAIQKLEEFSGEQQGALGIIYVDVIKHSNLASSFGIPVNTQFPIYVLLLDGSKHLGEDLVEIIFTDTLDSAKEEVTSWLENPETESQETASESSLNMVSHAKFNEFLSSQTKKYVLVAFCADDDAKCKTFGQNYRRLVRSLDFAISKPVGIRVIYVELAGQDRSKYNLPEVRLYKTASANSFVPLYGESSYDGMLKFIREQTKNQNVPRLLPSRSDLVPLNLKGETDTSDESNNLQGDFNYDDDDDDVSPEPEEVEDGEVAEAVTKMKKRDPKVVNNVPALTDKTFNTTKDTSLVLLVHFYVYWEPRCSAFHQPFADAAESLKKMKITDVKLARVNCFDWTDVCQKENITHYPTINMYRKGSEKIPYKAPLDSKHVLKSALLLLAEAPISIQSSGEATMFQEGKLPKSSNLVTDVAVLGMFNDESSPSLDAFRAAARILRGQFLFGYTGGEVTKQVARKLSVSLPAVVLFRRNDDLKPKETFNGVVTAENVVQFVRFNSLPVFGELTPLNLPLYYSHRKLFIIVFNSKNVEDQYSPIISEIARQSTRDVFFCWIDLTSNEVNSAILMAYTDDVKLPKLVAVDHGKGAVYQYSGDITKSSIEKWVKNCVIGSAKKKSSLKEKKWQPLMDGYDFLKKIQEDEGNKDKNKENSEAAEEGRMNEDSKAPEENSQEDKIQWKELSQNFKSAGQDSSEENENEEELEKSEELETEDNREQEEVSTSRLRLPRHHGHHDDKSSDHRSGHDEL